MLPACPFSYCKSIWPTLIRLCVQRSEPPKWVSGPMVCRRCIADGGDRTVHEPQDGLPQTAGVRTASQAHAGVGLLSLKGPDSMTTDMGRAPQLTKHEARRR